MHASPPPPAVVLSIIITIMGPTTQSSPAYIFPIFFRSTQTNPLSHSHTEAKDTHNTDTIRAGGGGGGRMRQQGDHHVASCDVETVHRLLAPDIDWWFHGPPSHNHLMRFLTGTTSANSFLFIPLSVVAFGSVADVEGYDDKGCSWVHAWTVTDGIITQVREYCKTSVTVARLGKGNGTNGASRDATGQSVWQSKLSGNASLPGLLFAL